MTDSWILIDPSGKHLDTGGPIFVKPDGLTTGDRNMADIFPSEDAAKKRSAQLSPPDYFVPRRLSDYSTVVSGDE